MTTDLIDRHRAALEVASTYVARVTDADLHRPTPCAAWDLAQLLDHMVGQHAGFATVVRAGAADAEAYQPQPFTPASWRRSVDDLLDAFARCDLDAAVVEVELHPTLPLPIAILVQAQFLDTVVHTWDVAAALGDRFDPGPSIAAEVESIAAVIPDDARSDAPGAAFAHAVPTGGSTWDRTLGMLGRDPGWQP